MRDCPPSSRGAVDPGNRCRSGSPAIDDFSRAEAQSRGRRLQTNLRAAAGEGAAMGGVPPGARPHPPPHRARSARQGVVPRTGRWSSQPRSWPPGDQLREHLPLRLHPDRPHQGLSMAPLSAARKEQTGLSRSKGRELCNLHRRPCFHNRTPYRGRRPQDCRPLGSRPHALLQTWPSRAHRPRALLASDRWVQAPSQGRGSRGSKTCRPVPGNATSHAQDHNVRQRHRVRTAPPATPVAHADLLL